MDINITKQKLTDMEDRLEIAERLISIEKRLIKLENSIRSLNIVEQAEDLPWK
jgi:hypothetical protein